MRRRLRQLFDVRRHELLPLGISVAYVGLVVASFLLAKPIRNGLFLNTFGAYRLVYVYVAIPLVLAVLVPLYTRVVARWGERRVILGSLLFFASNVLAFWALLRSFQWEALAAAFYIWVNCYGAVAPVQAWTFVSRLFDTRQAKRLFGLVGGGASIGAILGGLLARTLVEPIGGTVNLLLVLAGLIAAAAVLVGLSGVLLPARARTGAGRPRRVPFRRTLAEIAGTRYLRLLALMVTLVAVVTQWVQFQFSLAVEERFQGQTDLLTAFFGEFNFYMGITALLLQILLTGPALRRFGVGFTVMLLPAALAAGSFGILLAPVLAMVLVTSGLDQSLRFSIDKATFELLYLPIPAGARSHVKATIDVIVSRTADAFGGLLLGLATQGFNLVVFALPGLGLGLRGIAALNLVLLAAWLGVAMAVRRGYIETIQESIRQQRLDAERAAAAMFDRRTSGMLIQKLASQDPTEILYALALFEAEPDRLPVPAIRALLGHASTEVRRTAVSVLRGAGDRSAVPLVEPLLEDPDLEVRTQALLFLAEHLAIDPLERLERLGDFPDFSIKAGMIAFLSQPGRARNVEAASMLLETMLQGGGGEVRSRLEAARLLGSLPAGFEQPLRRLVLDPDADVARQAVRSVARRRLADLAPALLEGLDRDAVRADAVEALVALGDAVVEALQTQLVDPKVSLRRRKEIPEILRQLGTPASQRALIESLLQADTGLRFRIIAALNKLQAQRPDLAIDRRLLEVVLTAEIMGHYRSYQILGTLDPLIPDHAPVVVGLKRSIERETERIFRLLGLLFPGLDFHSAHFGLQSADSGLRANAFEFLDNTLKPELKRLLLPVIDPYVDVSERVRLANAVVGAPVTSERDAVRALLASQDSWLRASGIYMTGVLRLHDLASEVERSRDDPDAVVREAAQVAADRLAGEAPTAAEPVPWEAPEAVGVG